jgi:hypothetical protein
MSSPSILVIHNQVMKWKCASTCASRKYNPRPNIINPNISVNYEREVCF